MLVPEGLVHIAESVQVDEHHDRLRAAPTGSRQQMLGAIGKQRPVRQPGQRVIEPLVLHRAAVAAADPPKPRDEEQCENQRDRRAPPQL